MRRLAGLAGSLGKGSIGAGLPFIEKVCTGSLDRGCRTREELASKDMEGPALNLAERDLGVKHSFHSQKMHFPVSSKLLSTLQFIVSKIPQTGDTESLDRCG